MSPSHLLCLLTASFITISQCVKYRGGFGGEGGGDSPTNPLDSFKTSKQLFYGVSQKAKYMQTALLSQI